MYLDMTYIVLVLPAVIFSLWASWNVKHTYKKYAKQLNSRGLTGASAARRILDANGLQNIPVERISGELTDHYDPEARVVRLSDAVWDGTSTAAVGVACHEVGHAIQNAENYLPVKIRQAIIPATNIGARLSVPLLIAGLVLCGFIPQASATSIMAVSPLRAYFACTFLPSGSVTVAVWIFPPRASPRISTVPSPPSAKGIVIISASGHDSLIAWPIAPATSFALRQPL